MGRVPPRQAIGSPAVCLLLSQRKDTKMPLGFEKILVYQEAVDFAEGICYLTRSLPRGLFFLAEELNLAVLSIVANIVEGNGRFTKAGWLSTSCDKKRSKCYPRPRTLVTSLHGPSTTAGMAHPRAAAMSRLTGEQVPFAPSFIDSGRSALRQRPVPPTAARRSRQNLRRTYTY
jgi:hypothetical protein